MHPAPLLGGDRDIHGCVGSAGYSWCANKNKCLRVWEEKCEIATSTPTVTSTSTANYATSTSSTSTAKSIESCAQKNGIWYPAENICEANQLTESQCKVKGGIFNECASACRHDPTAQICTLQCVQTCTFK